MIGKFIGYARVSTVGQAEDGLGLEIQEATIRERIGDTHKGVQMHRDEGVSGALVDRPGLSNALRALAKGDVVIVAKLDRLARDLISQELLLREIRSKGARLWSCAPGEQPYIDDDADDPSRKFIRQILGATAEYEKAMITLRLRGGRRAKREKGEFAGGERPFGWKSSGFVGQLIPEPREQRVLGVIRDLRGEGLTYEQIAVHLNAAIDAGADLQPRRGKRWRKDNVHRIARPRVIPGIRLVVDDEMATA
jgi:DNA invertase Pin-like site-specific DNA recombinase